MNKMSVDLNKMVFSGESNPLILKKEKMFEDVYKFDMPYAAKKDKESRGGFIARPSARIKSNTMRHIGSLTRHRQEPCRYKHS